MKITDIEVVELEVPDWAPNVFDGSNRGCVIRVHTDEGVTGISEVISVPSVIRAIVEAPPVLRTARGLKAILVGEDPSDIPALWDRMYELTGWYGRRGVVLHAISGIDIALWDLKGRLEGVPIARLLGKPARDRIRACGTVYPTGTTPDEVRRNFDRYLSLGMRSLKMCINSAWRGDPDLAHRMVGIARSHVGPSIDLVIEASFAFDQADDVLPLLPVFREFGIAWLEGPLPLDDIAGHARLVGHGVQIGAGDTGLTTRFEYEQIMTAGGVDIVQPDVEMVGGFTELMRVAAIAREKGRRVIPHGYKTHITDAANLHFLAQHWTDEPLEYCLSASPLRSGLTRERLEIGTDGTVAVPDGPGLGVNLDETTLARYRVSP